MKTTRIVYCALVTSLALLGGEATAAPVRNEALASRFLYCSNVSQFFYQYLLKNAPNGQGVNGYRKSKDLFLLAATVASDEAYITSEKDKEMTKVAAVLEQEKREKAALMEAEAKSCLKTLQDDALPLLQSQQIKEQ